MNRLGQERSPYLLQHADNPVDWYPWGEDAFERARRDDRPIFLSIGYSTCHWCHVMEHESFENPAIADVLNRDFVSIKVDREERPDVDRVYMTFVQATTGSGGWPMSVWLTPELKPFYGGTYFPPSSRWGRPGFVEILRRDRARLEGRERGEGARVGRVAERLAAVDRQPTAAPRGARAGAGALRWNGRRAVPRVVRSAPRRLRRRAEVSAAVGAAVPAARARATGAGDEPDRSATWCCGRCARWRSAACAITSAAASIAIRSTAPGACRTSRRCSTTRRSWCSRTSRRRRRLAIRFYVEVAEDTLRYVMREMTDRGRRVLFRRGCRQRPAGAGGRSPAAHKSEGAFYCGAPTKSTRCSATTRRSSSCGSASSRTATRRSDPQQEFTGKNLLYVAQSIDEIAEQTGSPVDDVVDVLHGAASDAVRRAAGPAASASRRQGADGLERPDDRRVRARPRVRCLGRQAVAPAAASRCAQPGPAHSSASSCGTDAGTLLRRYRDGDAEIEATPRTTPT